VSNGLRTTVVGSWWPLPDFEEDLHRYHRGELSAEDGEALLKRAASLAIDEQRGLGLTEWTGGEHFDGDLAAPNGLGYVDAYVRERDLPGGVPKATVVGPVEVAINVINELDGLKGQMSNLNKIVNAELRGLAAATSAAGRSPGT